MSRELPAQPNLEHLKKQAKELLTRGVGPKLANAQHALAREYGFASWSKLKQHVIAAAGGMEPAKMLSAAVCASDAAWTARVLRAHPELKQHLNEPMAEYGEGLQALLAAVQRSDRKTIDVLLGAGADVRVRSESWQVGVMDECAPELAAFLVKRGAVIDAHAAARLGMLDRLRELVAAQPDVVGARGAWGQTPLHFASTVEVAGFLLDRDAEIDALDLRHESTPAQHMLRSSQARHYRRDRLDVARYLIGRGCRTDLLMAAALGDLDLARRHLDADPACIRTRVTEEYFPKRDEHSGGSVYFWMFGRGRTAHMVARDFGHMDVYDLLMERSPEDLKLAQACELGDERLFGALLASRPDFVATLSEADQRKLPDAAQNNNTAAVKLMLAAGWPVDVRGQHQLSALDWAAWHGNAEMVREVLRFGPDLEATANEFGISPLICALHGSENGWHRATGDYGATVEALLAAGAKAPKVTPDLEASEAARAALLRHESAAGG